MRKALYRYSITVILNNLNVKFTVNADLLNTYGMHGVHDARSWRPSNQQFCQLNILLSLSDKHQFCSNAGRCATRTADLVGIVHVHLPD